MSAQPDRFAPSLRVLHWLMAVLIVAMLGVGLVMTSSLTLRPLLLDIHRPLGVAILLGLVADLAFGGLLGEQAMRLAIMVFILDRFRARLRFFPVSQQAAAIGVLLANDRVVGIGIHLVLGAVQLPWTYWLAPVLGMVLWAPLHLVLDSLRLKRRG